VIREFCTFNTGTVQDRGVTTIGSHNWIMAYVHIAHDCVVGDRTIFANNASLAGHSEIGDWAILGGFTGVHQFCKIGAHVMTGISSVVFKDIPPFVMASGQPAAPHGLNSEGLKRRGFSAESLAALKRAYKILYREGNTLAEAQAKLEPEAANHAEVQQLLDSSRAERASSGMDLGVIAGEASGGPDAHFIAALKQATHLRAAGIAGPRMIEAGVAAIYPAKLAVNGYVSAAPPARTAVDPLAHHAISRERARSSVSSAGFQFHPGSEAQAGRHSHRALRQPVDLGLAAGAHPSHQAGGVAHAGGVSVRGADLSGRRHSGQLRRPPAGRRDPFGT
jgi:carbonic anhydrase/acetyltransferase-like protein (isoleucine patch superfamily)